MTSPSARAAQVSTTGVQCTFSPHIPLLPHLTPQHSRDELELEREALEDAELDEAELAQVPPDVNAATRPAADGPPPNRPSSPLSTEEIEKAREFRAKGLNEDGPSPSLSDCTTISLSSSLQPTSLPSRAPPQPSAQAQRHLLSRSPVTLMYVIM